MSVVTTEAGAAGARSEEHQILVHDVTTSAASPAIEIGSNPNRLAFIVANNGTAVIRMLPDGVPSATLGITIPANNFPFILSCRELGYLVCHRWGFQTAGVNQHMTVIEVISRNAPAPVVT